MPDPITTGETKDAIEGQGSRIDTADMEGLFGAVQEDIVDYWEEYLALVEDGELTLNAEIEDALVFAIENGEFWQRQFDLVADYINLLGTGDE